MATMKRSLLLTLASLMLLLCQQIHGWGVDGHLAVCRIAQARLSAAAAEAVKQLLPDSAEGDLGSECSWADRVKFRYRWSSALHYIDTPDNLCSYAYASCQWCAGDCKDENGEKDRCVAGGINNYTSQLLTYKKGSSQSDYNLTEALLFLSHFVGDIHQPLHVGFTSDRGGNTIEVHWYRRKTNLHHVWDDNVIETEVKNMDADIDGLIKEIQSNITTEWSDRVAKWEACGSGLTACPDIYAAEGIKAACQYAYKGVEDGSVLADDYFYSRAPIVNLRLAQGGVRLAATLNRIFA